MGRYCNGDIENKMLFAIQKSDDADNFGVKGILNKKRDAISYNFKRKDIPIVRKNLAKYIGQMGVYHQKLTEYFEKHDGFFNTKDVARYLGVTETKAEELLKLDARITLGESILGCLEEQGKCSFCVDW